MIDLTPLDVRKKRGDFRRILRGYDPEEVDGFLQLVAERMEELVRENLGLVEKVARLQEQVGSLESRERAVHDALVTAERLRSDVKEQARREADVVRKEAEGEARRIVEAAERAVAESEVALGGLERERRQFLGAFRALLERQMERLDTEEESLGEEAGGGSRRGWGTGSRRTWAVGGSGVAAAAAGAADPEADAVPEPGPGLEVPEPEPPGAVAEPASPEYGIRSTEEAPENTPAAGVSDDDNTPVPQEAPAEDLSSWLAGFLEDEEPPRG